MNIFFLDKDPRKIARYHVDAHARGKMLLEIAQMCSTAKRLVDNYRGNNVYKISYINHPMTKWVRSSRENFAFAIDLGIALYDEKRYRFGGNHKSIYVLDFLVGNYPQFSIEQWYDPPQCMPEIYKHEDYIQAYRNYYAKEKIPRLGAEWTGRLKPDWYKENDNE